MTSFPISHLLFASRTPPTITRGKESFPSAAFFFFLIISNYFFFFFPHKHIRISTRDSTHTHTKKKKMVGVFVGNTYLLFFIQSY